MSSTTEKRKDRLQGKVAQLLNERELVINIGESDGVRPGMKFKVLAESPVEISDPETDKPLGTIDREKVRVQAVDVRPEFAVCSTFKTRFVGGGAMYGALRELSGPLREVAETLKAEDSEYLSPLSEEESYVKRGDRVVELTDDEQ